MMIGIKQFNLVGCFIFFEKLLTFDDKRVFEKFLEDNYNAQVSVVRRAMINQPELLFADEPRFQLILFCIVYYLLQSKETNLSIESYIHLSEKL